MVNGRLTGLGIGFAMMVGAFVAGPAWSGSSATSSDVVSPYIAYAPVLAIAQPAPAPTPAKKPKPVRTRPVRTKSGATLPIPIDAVLDAGVLIVISKATQDMYVFRDGEYWDRSPVSTGKRGKETPTGVFPILQKRRHHRSNIYANAPMPYMQRMTWGGIAIHEGKLPGYPASHGCIRLPRKFARALFQLTARDTTTVVVTDNAFASSADARLLAKHMPMPEPGQRGHLIQGREPQLAQLKARYDVSLAMAEQPMRGRTRMIERETPARSVAQGRVQTIQLAAAESEAEANAYWARIRTRFPELARFEKRIIPATVNSKRYYRLRVSGAGAGASCVSLRRSGSDCFRVR